MRFLLLVITLFSQLALAQNAAVSTRLQAAGFTDAQVFDYDLSKYNSKIDGPAKTLDLVVVAFSRDTLWTRASAVSETTTAAKVLNQCGIKMRRLVLITSPGFEKYTNSIEFTWPGNGRVANVRKISEGLRAAAPNLPRLSGFFVKSTYHFDNGKMIYGQGASHPDYWVGQAPEVGSIVIPSEVLTPEYKSSRLPNYSTVAHEIAHILLDDPENHSHLDVYGNLMANSVQLGGAELTREQCTRMRASPYLH